MGVGNIIINVGEEQAAVSTKLYQSE